MSETSDVSSDQEKELRRRNVNLGSGDYSDSVINKATLDENKANADDSDRDIYAENQIVDSDQVSKKRVLKKILSYRFIKNIVKEKKSYGSNKVILVNWIN